MTTYETISLLISSFIAAISLISLIIVLIRAITRTKR